MSTTAIERIEIFVTELPVRIRRTRLNWSDASGWSACCSYLWS